MIYNDETRSNGRLFDIALRMLGLHSFKGVLLVDDTKTYCDIFKKKGGEVYQYSSQEDFSQWSKN